MTATATVTATPTPTEWPPVSDPEVFAALVGWDSEYSADAVRNLARVICHEVRTGERSRSFPWRQMIGYAGEKAAGSFIAYSVATYCPELGNKLIDAG